MPYTQDSPESVRPAYSGSSLLSSAQEKGTAAISSLHLPVPARCPSSSLVFTPVVWDLEWNHLGNMLNMQVVRRGFLTPMVRDALEAAFHRLPDFLSCSHVQSCWVKAGGAGGQSRALGQETRIETAPPPSSLLCNPERVVSPLCASAPPQSACLSGSRQT